MNVVYASLDHFLRDPGHDGVKSFRGYRHSALALSGREYVCFPCKISGSAERWIDQHNPGNAGGHERKPDQGMYR